MYEKEINNCQPDSIFLAACTESVDDIVKSIVVKGAIADSSQFITYTILKAEQYCDKSVYKAVKYEQLLFIVNLSVPLFIKQKIQKIQKRY